MLNYDFKPLLAYKWYVATMNTGTLYGKFAEDGSEYKINAPPSLVNAIVSMQNYVFDLYKEIDERQKSIELLTKELDEYKKARGYRE